MRFGILAALALALGMTSASAEPVVLKFSADTPSSGSNWTNYFKPWADRVTAASQGTLKIETYPDGTLSKIGDTVDRVVAGVADIGWDFPLNYGARYASFGVVGLPNLYTDAEAASAALFRGWQKGTIGKELNDVKLLFVWADPPHGVFMKEAPKSNTDLSGLKFVLGSKQRAQIIQAMGGVPLAMASREYYQALQKGVADGALTSKTAMNSNKIGELLRYYLDAPFGGGITIVFMNKKVYDALPPQAKKAIDETSGEKGSREVAAMQSKAEAEYMAKLLADPANKSVKLTAAELAKWQSAAFDPVITDWTKTTPGGEAVIAAFKAEIAAGK